MRQTIEGGSGKVGSGSTVSREWDKNRKKRKKSQIAVRVAEKVIKNHTICYLPEWKRSIIYFRMYINIFTT